MRPENDKNYYIFRCEPRSFDSMVCPCCEKVNYRIHDYHERNIQDINMGVIKVEILLRTPRYECKETGRVFSHQYQSIDSNRHLTNRFKEYVQQLSIDSPFSRVAQMFDLSVPTVSALFLEYAKERFKNYTVTAPRVLGIDENYVGKHARGVFVDIENGKLLEMSENNKPETMIKMIQSFEGFENIEIVTMDMSGGYNLLIQNLLPNATVVVDKFHVIQDAGRHFKKVKKQVFENAKKEAAKIKDEKQRAYCETLLATAAKNRHLFDYTPKNLSPKSKSLIAELCELFPSINQLRLQRTLFYNIYESETREEAIKKYDEWCNSIPQTEEFEQLKSLKKTIDRWHLQIFNYFNCRGRYTNAATEGVNSLIKDIRNRGKSYTFAALRYKCLMNTKASDEYEKRRRLRRTNAPKPFTTYKVTNASGQNWDYDFFDDDLPVGCGTDINTLLKLLHSENDSFL